ncbi:MAG: twin-arginine translocation signal domain-containing protein [Hyphomicrobiales bacterium]|nr:twin-arginine translocation signal domain-containing protein [Hyphomicrobiales bacterium]
MTTDWTVDRRAFLAGAGAAAASLSFSPSNAQTVPGPKPGDRVFLTNEDSNTLSVINAVTDTVEATVNLTSFDEDPRPPFRFVTGGMAPTHGAMVQRPLYHGAISIHGCAPSPDSNLLATAGRGTSNLYLIDTRTLKVVGNRPNPQAGPNSNPEAITSGVLVGREPHEPTFTRTGREIWVALRGEDKIAVVDVEKARAESAGDAPRGSSLRRFVPVLPGPAMVWFSRDGRIAFVISQKVPRIDIFDVAYDAKGYSSERRRGAIDIAAADKFGFSPFLKRNPSGSELWMTHKLSDAVSVLSTAAEPKLTETIPLGDKARPNHVEFVENASGRVVYASLARIDDGGPGGVASSRIAIIDRAAPPGSRKVAGAFFSHGRDAHGVWADPSNTKLYIAHEGDELPGTPNGGQTVCSVFDIADVFKPRFIAQIPLGDLELPSGRLRNKKSINLVYVRPGAPSATA